MIAVIAVYLLGDKRDGPIVEARLLHHDLRLCAGLVGNPVDRQSSRCSPRLGISCFAAIGKHRAVVCEDAASALPRNQAVESLAGCAVLGTGQTLEGTVDVVNLDPVDVIRVVTYGTAHVVDLRLQVDDISDGRHRRRVDLQRKVGCVSDRRCKAEESA